MLLKALVTALIGGILFPFFMKLFTRSSTKKETTNFVIQGVSFAVFFFIMLLITGPFITQ